MTSRRIATGIVAAATALSLGLGTTATAVAAPNAGTGSTTNTTGPVQSANLGAQSAVNSGSGILSSAVSLGISAAMVVAIYNFLVDQHIIQPLKTA